MKTRLTVTRYLKWAPFFYGRNTKGILFFAKSGIYKVTKGLEL